MERSTYSRSKCFKTSCKARGERPRRCEESRFCMLAATTLAARSANEGSLRGWCSGTWGMRRGGGLRRGLRLRSQPTSELSVAGADHSLATKGSIVYVVVGVYRLLPKPVASAIEVAREGPPSRGGRRTKFATGSHLAACRRDQQRVEFQYSQPIYVGEQLAGPATTI